MTLAIEWLHEAGDQPHPAPRGGSMTLAIRWLHEGGETLGTWLHEAGDWHLFRLTAAKIDDPLTYFGWRQPTRSRASRT